MNLIAIARHGIGITGPPPLAVAVARGIVLALIRHAEPSALVVQAAAGEAELGWLRRLARRMRAVSLPPGVAFAARVSNGDAVVGTVLVAEREADLGHRLGCVVRIGPSTIVLDRRDGSLPVEVAPEFLDLEGAMRVGAVSPPADASRYPELGRLGANAS